MRTAHFAAVPSPPPDKIQEKAADIFGRPEFDPSAASLDWLEVLARWFGDFLKSLGGLATSAPTLYWVLLVGLTVLLIVLLAHIGYTVYRAVTYSESSAAGGERAARLHLSTGHADLARARAEAGDYTEAIRHLFLALVLRFDERGRVVLRPAVTNREYLRQLSEYPQVQSELEVFVNTLDDHWYGQRPAPRSQYERCDYLYRELLAG